MSEFGGIGVATMKQAVQTYVDIAWAGGQQPPKSSVEIQAAVSLDEVLALFQRDLRAGTMRKYTLRLGNDRYPFMKLVFQELIVRDRFFFAVDTHDEMDLKDSFKDYEQWLELKAHNQDLRARIEEEWRRNSVPTILELVAQVERETPPGPAVARGAPLILVVDDEPGISQVVVTILSRAGYRTAVADSGERGLEVLAEARVDLVLSDLEMGGMSGLDFAGRIRAEEKETRVPFILATAASISPTNFHVIDGFLVKPYDADLLLKFVASHLPRQDSGGR